MSRADRDVDALEPLLIQGPPELLSALLRAGLSSLLLWHIHPTLFLALAAILPLLFSGLYVFKRISSRNWALVAENRSRFTPHLVETVNGVRILQQTVQQAPNQQRYRGLLNDFNNALIHGNIRASWFAPLTGVLSAASMAALTVRWWNWGSHAELTASQGHYAALYLAYAREETVAVATADRDAGVAAASLA